MILHTVEEAVAIAERLRATPDADLHRAATGLSLKAICSIAILAHQLDELARTAAAHLAEPRNIEVWTALQERLIQAGYLPIQKSPASQEAADGAR